MKFMAKFFGLSSAILITAFFSSRFFLFYPDSSEQWAAWVQAIGSVGAIGAACWAVVIQRRNQLEDNKLQRRRLEAASLGFLLQVAHETSGTVRLLSTYMHAYSTAKPFSFNIRRLEECLESLRAVPIADLPVEMYSVVLQLQRAVIISIRAAERRQGTRNPITATNLERAQERSSAVRDLHARVREAVERYVDLH